jgi:hypothetical protein
VGYPTRGGSARTKRKSAPLDPICPTAGTRTDSTTTDGPDLARPHACYGERVGERGTLVAPFAMNRGNEFPGRRVAEKRV